MSKECTHSRWTFREDDYVGEVWCPDCKKSLPALEQWRALLAEMRDVRDQLKMVLQMHEEGIGGDDD